MVFFCLANLSKSAVEIDPFDHGTMNVSEIVLDEEDSYQRVNVPDTEKFTPTISPGEALLLEFTYRPPDPCVRPKCTLKVAGQQFCRELRLHKAIEMEISNNVVVTAVELVRVVMCSKDAQFPPEICRRLPDADFALFVEDKANAVILDLLDKYPCYYSPYRVQALKQDLKQDLCGQKEGGKCQVS
jgi:hypothetical protein